MKKTIERALFKGGEVLMTNFLKGHEVHRKENPSNVMTEVDLLSASKIREVIFSEFSTHNILDEEQGLIDNDSDFTWIIDPLDGTSNYISRLPWFGVLIAVAKRCEITMAGAYLPHDDVLYFAEKGKGAFRNGMRIHISQEESLSNALVSHSMDCSQNEKTIDKALSIFRLLVQKTRNIRATNSLVELCYTADGRLQGSVNLSTMLWDIAAPTLIIQEAGGVVTDLGGNEIVFDPRQDHQGKFPIVAANATLHKMIIQLINRDVCVEF